MKIYADNAATTRVSDTALAAMTPCFQEIYGNPSSLHTPGQRAAEKLAAARAIFARNLHADPREITFTSGGSEADNQALRTAAALGEKRGGTEDIPGICGAAAAFDEACATIEQNAAYLTPLRDRLIAGLTAIPHTALNGDSARRLPGNVNVCFEGIEGESLLLLLDEKGIAASSGSACTSGSLDPSHVLLALGRPHEVAHGSLRLSLSHENRPEEIDYILEVLPGIVSYLRGMSPVWDELETGLRPHLI